MVNITPFKSKLLGLENTFYVFVLVYCRSCVQYRRDPRNAIKLKLPDIGIFICCFDKTTKLEIGK